MNSEKKSQNDSKFSYSIRKKTSTELTEEISKAEVLLRALEGIINKPVSTLSHTEQIKNLIEVVRYQGGIPDCPNYLIALARRTA